MKSATWIVLALCALTLLLIGCTAQKKPEETMTTETQEETVAKTPETTENAAPETTAAAPSTEADPEEFAAIQPVPTLAIEAGDRIFYADLEDNSSAEAFIEQLSREPVTLELHDYGSFEKVGPLPWALPRNDETITTEPGDVILYQGDQITIYYDENTWSFTRLAKIGSVTRDELLEALGPGDVTVRMWIEWSE